VRFSSFEWVCLGDYISEKHWIAMNSFGGTSNSGEGVNQMFGMRWLHQADLLLSFV